MDLLLSYFFYFILKVFDFFYFVLDFLFRCISFVNVT